MLKTTIDCLLLEFSGHNHCSDNIKFSKLPFASKLKQRILNTSETSRVAFSNVMSEFNYSNIIDYKMMNSLVTRVRKTNNLTIVKEYDIPYKLTKTTRGKKFLFYDSEIHDENRIVVFTTD